MKKLNIPFIYATLLVALVGFAQEPTFIFPPTYPYPGAVGAADSTAIPKDDSAIVAWASAVVNYSPGTQVDATWQDSTKGLGAAQGTSYEIVCLGRGGQITLTFAQAIYDGTSDDFAVFENSFSDQFLELAWVEVSSDGTHFVRFPNFSQTISPVGGFGTVDAKKVHGFAGKYRAGYGTPFDLAEIKAAYAAAVADDELFPTSYSDDLLANYPYVDFDDIRYVRLIDVVGDGTQQSALRQANADAGYTLYDPYPTVGSAGFDLDAVAVLNELATAGLAQTIDFPEISHQRLADATLSLQASSTSDLSVEFEVLSGPATVIGDELHFTGLGLVTVQATQQGDASYAPAAAIIRSFYIADELQTIFVLPPSNQLIAATEVPFAATSSSGLPVSLFVDEGPEQAIIGEFSHLFSSGSTAGTVSLLAVQSGGVYEGVTYAPAEDIRIEFAIAAPDSAKAPRSFSSWQSSNSISGDASLDSDLDGLTDLEEYMAGTDPLNASHQVRYALTSNDNALEWQFRLDRRAQLNWAIETNDDLAATNNWNEIVPEIIEMVPTAAGDETYLEIRLRFAIDPTAARFWRLRVSPN